MMDFTENLKLGFLLTTRFKKARAIAEALSCKGWTGKPKLSTLFDLTHKVQRLEGDILEIGSAWGRSTVLLGQASSRTVWSVDPHTGGRAYIERGEKQESYDEFLANLNRCRVSSQVRVLKNTTQEVAVQNLIPNPIQFCLVFIDGLHTSEGVKVDFDFAYPRLISSGVMVFDDYFEPTVKDYKEQIDQLIEDHSLRLIRDKRSRLVWLFKP